MTWLQTGFSILAQLLVAAFVYGRLTERVRGHGKRLDVIEPKVDKLQTQVAYMRGERG